MSTDFSAAKEVFETTSENTANRYIRAGWKLAAVAPYQDDDASCLIYGLFWDAEGDPVILRQP